jgi:hypothetical protein
MTDHCVSKIVEIVARAEGDPRSIFQLGYNLGRLSEITGLGREPFWDRWKHAVAEWNQAELRALARELQTLHDLQNASKSAEYDGDASPT